MGALDGNTAGRCFGQPWAPCIGTIEGPVVGTLLFFALRELLAEHGAWYMIVLGAVAVVTMLACPQRLWGWVAQRFDLHFFPVQRRVHP